MFTEKTATFKGAFKNLDMFKTCGIKYASIKKFNNTMNMLKITWICENPDTDIHDLIDVIQMENWNIELISMNN